MVELYTLWGGGSLQPRAVPWGFYCSHGSDQSQVTIVLVLRLCGVIEFRVLREWLKPWSVQQPAITFHNYQKQTTALEVHVGRYILPYFGLLLRFDEEVFCFKSARQHIQLVYTPTTLGTHATGSDRTTFGADSRSTIGVATCSWSSI